MVLIQMARGNLKNERLFNQGGKYFMHQFLRNCKEIAGVALSFVNFCSYWIRL